MNVKKSSSSVDCHVQAVSHLGGDLERMASRWGEHWSLAAATARVCTNVRSEQCWTESSATAVCTGRLFWKHATHRGIAWISSLLRELSRWSLSNVVRRQPLSLHWQKWGSANFFRQHASFVLSEGRGTESVHVHFFTVCVTVIRSTKKKAPKCA